MSTSKALVEKPADELGALLDRVQKNIPSQADLDTLRKLITPENWRSVGDLMTQAESKLIESLGKNRATQEINHRGAVMLRRELGYGQATAIEKLLIDAVVLAWLRYGLLEYVYTSSTASGTWKQIEGWDKHLAQAQRRYLKACESLAKVRRLLRLPNVQVNIATNGGQQVNLA